MFTDMGKAGKLIDSGPVAQLGARFHGMEEVIGSIPIRSTKPSLYNLEMIRADWLAVICASSRACLGGRALCGFPPVPFGHEWGTHLEAVTLGEESRSFVFTALRSG